MGIAIAGDKGIDKLKTLGKGAKAAGAVEDVESVEKTVKAAETVKGVADAGKVTEVTEMVDDVVSVGEKALEGGLNSVDDIIKGVEDGDILLENTIQKGNYGEMKMDVYFEEQGYERISLDKVTDLDATTHQGIDGVYYNPDGNPPYIIGEAKYGSSRLSTLADGTKQMST